MSDYNYTFPMPGGKQAAIMAALTRAAGPQSIGIVSTDARKTFEDLAKKLADTVQSIVSEDLVITMKNGNKIHIIQA